MEQRKPLSFWGTVGAFMVGGVVLGGLNLMLSLLFVRSVASKAAIEATQQPQQPTNGGG